MASTSAYEIFTMVFSVIILIVYVIGYAFPEHLVKQLSVPSKNLTADINIGMYEGCGKTIVPSPFNSSQTITIHTCRSYAEEDWQRAAGALAIIAFLLTFFVTVLTFVVVCVPKVHNSVGVKTLLAVLQFIVVGCIAAMLIIFKENDKFNLPIPPDEMAVTFDIGWSFIVHACAAGLMAIYLVCTICNIMRDVRLNGRLA